MDLPPQPPPGQGAPVLTPQAARSRSLMKAIIALGIVSLLVSTCVIPAYFNHRTRRVHPNWMEAVRNMKQLGLLLFQFDQDHGAFPNPDTALIIAADHKLAPLPTTTSNDLLGQLLHAKLTKSEEVFWCRHPRLPSKRPDNVISPPSRVLEPGECGFSYVTGLNSTSPVETPVILAPMIPGTTTFDRKAFDGHAVVLRVDQSVRHYKLDKSGRVILPNGLDIFDPRQPFWAGKTPDLRHPAQ